MVADVLLNSTIEEREREREREREQRGERECCRRIGEKKETRREGKYDIYSG